MFSFHEMMHVHIDPRQDKYQNIPGVEQVKFMNFFCFRSFGTVFIHGQKFWIIFPGDFFPNLWEFPNLFFRIIC
jgi:hypothetical protein